MSFIRIFSKTPRILCSSAPRRYIPSYGQRFLSSETSPVEKAARPGGGSGVQTFSSEGPAPARTLPRAERVKSRDTIGSRLTAFLIGAALTGFAGYYQLSTDVFDAVSQVNDQVQGLHHSVHEYHKFSTEEVAVIRDRLSLLESAALAQKTEDLDADMSAADISHPTDESPPKVDKSASGSTE
eukprot:206763_1